MVAIPAGALAGAVVGRASKPVALVAGTTVIAVTIATQVLKMRKVSIRLKVQISKISFKIGVLDPVDQNQLSRDVRTARRQLDEHLRRNNLPSTNQMRQFFKKNQTLTIAGAGAFLVSLAFKLR